MNALLATVFLASLAGSVHCVGMCGPFVALGVGLPSRGALGHLGLQAAYHGGRLGGYAALGAAAGALGAALDLGGAFFGLQRAALMLAGAAMIGFGAVTLLRHHGLRVARPGVPRPLARVYRSCHAAAVRLGPVRRAAALGSLSALLPCGWLYAFVVTAAGTGGAVRGAATMAVFWCGTLPLLAALGAGVRRAAGPLRRHLPTVAALALVAVGLAALLGRLGVPPVRAEPPAGPAEALERAATLEPGDAACHDGGR